MRASRVISSLSVRLIADTIVSGLPSGRAGVSNAGDVGSTSGEYTHCVAVLLAGFGARSAALAASFTSASTPARSSVRSLSVAIPFATRYCAIFLIGSLIDSASRSSLVLYSDSSSEYECEYGRVTRAWTAAGPLRARTYATASRIAARLARKSVPSTESTWRPGNERRSFETSPPGVWHSTGTEMA